MTELLKQKANPIDVFAAARWLGELWNSTARAVSLDTVEWQCKTWGSGRGAGVWLDVAVFKVVAETFELETWWNVDGRAELVVSVPLEQFPRVVDLIDELGEDPESWPWFCEEAYEADNVQAAQIVLAAQVLGLPAILIADRPAFLEALGIG